VVRLGARVIEMVTPAWLAFELDRDAALVRLAVAWFSLAKLSDIDHQDCTYGPCRELSSRTTVTPPEL